MFLYCEQQETLKQLQNKLGEILKHKGDEIRFVVNGAPLDGDKTVADCKLENDAVVSFVFKTGLLRFFNFLT